MIDTRRLRAPAEPFGILIEPSAADIIQAADAGFQTGDCRLAGIPLGELRAELRRECRLAAPVILTGHQAEFFHAGVFSKILAARFVADAVSGTPVFLTVDSDVPKNARLAVPHQ